MDLLFQGPMPFQILLILLISILFRFHGYAYDGIWAIALAIHRVNEEAIKQNQTMLDFQYR